MQRKKIRTGLSELKEKRGRHRGETVETEKVRAVGTGVLSETGQSGEQSWAGGMVLLTTDKLRFLDGKIVVSKLMSYYR